MTSPPNERRQGNEFSQLQQAISALGDHVESLTSAHQRITEDLRSSQRELEETVEEAATVARTVKAETSAQAESFKADIGRARRGARSAFAGAIVAALLGCTAALLGYETGHNQLSDFKNGRIALCKQSNADKIAAAAETRKTFGPLYVKYTAEAHPNDVIAAILGGLAAARPIGVVNCAGPTSSSSEPTPTP